MSEYGRTSQPNDNAEVIAQIEEYEKAAQGYSFAHAVRIEGTHTRIVFTGDQNPVQRSAVASSEGTDPESSFEDIGILTPSECRARAQDLQYMLDGDGNDYFWGEF